MISHGSYRVVAEKRASSLRPGDRGRARCVPRGSGRRHRRARFKRARQVHYSESDFRRTCAVRRRDRQRQRALDGTQISVRSAREIVRAGLLQVPEARARFATLTVEENLSTGGFTCTRASAPKPSSNLRASRATCRATSSRWWRSAARSWDGRAHSCSTSRRWVPYPYPDRVR